MSKLQRIYRAIRETAPHMSKDDARYAAIHLCTLGFELNGRRFVLSN